MYLLTTAAKIKTILDTVSSSILPLKFKYTETMPSSFPSANISFIASGEERFLDTITNEVEAQFLISLVFPTEESQNATEKWLTLVDAMSDEFRKDDHQTLTGTATKFKILGTRQEIRTDFSQPVVVFSMTLGVTMIKAINA